MKDKLFTVKVDADTLDKFRTVSERVDLSMSSLVYKFMRDCVDDIYPAERLIAKSVTDTVTVRGSEKIEVIVTVRTCE